LARRGLYLCGTFRMVGGRSSTALLKSVTKPGKRRSKWASVPVILAGLALLCLVVLELRVLRARAISRHEVMHKKAKVGFLMTKQARERRRGYKVVQKPYNASSASVHASAKMAGIVGADLDAEASGRSTGAAVEGDAFGGGESLDVGGAQDPPLEQEEVYKNEDEEDEEGVEGTEDDEPPIVQPLSGIHGHDETDRKQERSKGGARVAGRKEPLTFVFSGDLPETRMGEVRDPSPTGTDTKSRADRAVSKAKAAKDKALKKSGFARWPH